MTNMFECHLHRNFNYPAEDRLTAAVDSFIDMVVQQETPACVHSTHEGRLILGETEEEHPIALSSADIQLHVRNTGRGGMFQVLPSLLCHKP